AAVTLTGQPGFRIFTPASQKEELLARLQSAGAAPATAEEARIVRIENGKPRYGEDILDTALPQETRQMHGVSFTKGCYLGQEIVERIRARGHVNRELVRIQIDAADVPEPGTKVTADGAEVGEITSAVRSPQSNRAVGMAYVRVQFAGAGTELNVGGKPAHVG